MTNKEFIVEVSEKLKISRKDTAKALDAICDVISEHVANGESVKITRFGTFSAVSRKGRRAVNVYTGEAMDIPPSVMVRFKAAEKLRAMIRGRLSK